MARCLYGISLKRISPRTKEGMRTDTSHNMEILADQRLQRKKAPLQEDSIVQPIIPVYVEDKRDRITQRNSQWIVREPVRREKPS